jgi:hypothetical protein
LKKILSSSKKIDVDLSCESENIPLLELAEDRKVTGNEIFTCNAWYGFSKILKRYCNWTLPIPMVVPHGVDYARNSLIQEEAEAGLPIYYYPEFRKEVFENAGLRVIAGCSPWLYLLKIRNKKIKTERIGSVVLPPKSLTNLNVGLKNELAFIAELKNLPSYFFPMKVCLYWRDIQLGRNKIYEKNGLEVVTAGHMNDPLFSYRLFDIFNEVEFLYTPIDGSHLFYAASMGLKVLWKPHFKVAYDGSEQVLKKDLWFGDQDIMEEMEHYFCDESSFSSQKAYAEKFLGIENLRSRISLWFLFCKLSLNKNILTKIILQMLSGLTPSSFFWDLNELEVENWGPRIIMEGEVPNTQSNGNGAIWIKLKENKTLSGGEVCLGAVNAIHTELQPGLITATFPKEVFDDPGKIPVYIRSRAKLVNKYIGELEILKDG